MSMKNFYLILPLTLLITSCGGGGGGSAGSATPTYTYSKMLDRFENGSVSSFTEVGRSLLYTYHEETDKIWMASRTSNFNVDFSQGTDSNPYFTVSYNQDVEVIPTGYTTSIDYKRNYDVMLTSNDIIQLSKAPNFSKAIFELRSWYSERGRIFEKLFVYGTWDTAVYPGTEYVDMMIWNLSTYQTSLEAKPPPYTSAPHKQKDDFIAFAFGEKTYSGDLPTSGSATYNLATIGFWKYNNSRYAFKGDGSLTANFSSMKIDGELKLDYVTNDLIDWSQLLNTDAGTIGLAGDISGSSFSGTVSWYSSEDGYFEGNFFGPDAKEVGGTFTASEPENSFNNSIIGSFIGVR